MQQLPTAASESPEVSRALASIDAAKQDSDPEVARCLDAVADLIRQSGAPDTIFERVIQGLASEELRALAASHGLQLFLSTEASVDEGTVTDVVLFWPNFAILPHGQTARASLDQLRAAIAGRLTEDQLAADFQASVAAGHTETVEAWYARTTRAAE